RNSLTAAGLFSRVKEKLLRKVICAPATVLEPVKLGDHEEALPDVGLQAGLPATEKQKRGKCGAANRIRIFSGDLGDRFAPIAGRGVARPKCAHGYSAVLHRHLDSRDAACAVVGVHPSPRQRLWVDDRASWM